MRCSQAQGSYGLSERRRIPPILLLFFRFGLLLFLPLLFLLLLLLSPPSSSRSCPAPTPDSPSHPSLPHGRRSTGCWVGGTPHEPPGMGRGFGDPPVRIRPSRAAGNRSRAQVLGDRAGHPWNGPSSIPTLPFPPPSFPFPAFPQSTDPSQLNLGVPPCSRSVWGSQAPLFPSSSAPSSSSPPSPPSPVLGFGGSRPLSPFSPRPPLTRRPGRLPEPPVTPVRPQLPPHAPWPSPGRCQHPKSSRAVPWDAQSQESRSRRKKQLPGFLCAEHDRDA